MSVLHLFMNEVDKITLNRYRSFAVDVLANVPEYYGDIREYAEHTRKAFAIVEHIVDYMQLDDIPRDILLCAALLQDVTRYEIKDGEIVDDYIHPLTVRAFARPFKGELSEDEFDDIMRTIESSHGIHSPIPQVKTDLSDNVLLWILPLANCLAEKL